MARTLRVAHLVPVGLPGTGAGRFVTGLCRALRGAGVDPAIIACHGEDAAAAVLAPQLRQGGFDAVHAHGADAARALSALLRDWPLLPTLATLHEGPGRGWRGAWRLRQALRAMDDVTASTRPLATRHAVLSGRTVAVTPPGIDLAQFAALAARRPGQGAPLRFAMALSGKSAAADAVQAMDRLVAQGLDVALHLSVPAGPTEALRRLGASRPWLHLEDEGADAAEFLSGKHAFLMPAPPVGGALPLLAEAMAAGLPCVLGDARPLRAAAAEAGVFARAGDSRDLAWQMARVTLDELLWHRLAKASRARAGRFGMDAVAGRFAARYRRMLARERSVSGLMFAR